MKHITNNWKQALVVGLLVSGSVLVGCKSRDYKAMEQEPPAGDATTMDSSRQMPVDEAVTSKDNTSDKSSAAVKTTTPRKGTKGRASIDMSYMKSEYTDASKSSMKAVRDADGIYSRADVMPMFPGGQDALQKFVESNVEYPADAVDQGSEADVKVIFTVNESGKVTNVKAVADNGTEYKLKEEAVAVVNKMPDWTPGMVNGKKVKTRLQLPISFKIVE